MQAAPNLRRDGIRSNRHRALGYRSSMIPRVKPDGMLSGKPLRTFPDHALDAAIRRMGEPPSTLGTPLLAKRF
jgi:hypothetical protein